MASSPTTVLSRRVDIEVSRAEIVPHAALAWLDVGRLEKVERAVIEIGSVKTGCCERTVRAIVEYGSVTGFDMEMDEDDFGGGARPDPALLDLLEEASKAIDPPPDATLALPLPLARLQAKPGILVQWWTCFTICIWGWCIHCCYGRDPGGPFALCYPPRRIGT